MRRRPSLRVWSTASLTDFSSAPPERLSGRNLARAPRYLVLAFPPCTRHNRRPAAASCRACEGGKLVVSLTKLWPRHTQTSATAVSRHAIAIIRHRAVLHIYSCVFVTRSAG